MVGLSPTESMPCPAHKKNEVAEETTSSKTFLIISPVYLTGAVHKLRKLQEIPISEIHEFDNYPFRESKNA